MQELVVEEDELYAEDSSSFGGSLPKTPESDQRIDTHSFDFLDVDADLDDLDIEYVAPPKHIRKCYDREPTFTYNSLIESETPKQIQRIVNTDPAPKLCNPMRAPNYQNRIRDSTALNDILR